MRKIFFTVIKAFLFFVGWVLAVSLIPVPEFENPAVWRFAAELIPFLCIVGMSILFWMIEKRKVQIVSFSDLLKNCLVGIIGGGIWLGSAAFIMLFIGVLKISDADSIPMLWLWIFSVFINTIMQELLVRGYLYQVIKREYNVIAAAVISTALFTFMHGGAFEAGIIPVLNVVTMSFLMTAVLEYTHSLLAPVIMHFLWNSAGAVILGGVSLAEDYPHLLNAVFSGNILLSGGICKMEGSIIVLLVNMVLIGFFIVPVSQMKGDFSYEAEHSYQKSSRSRS